MLIPVDAIKVGSNHRKVVPAKVKELVVSIETIGLKTPIAVLPGSGGKYRLVAGRHRLEAYRRLGRADIEAAVVQDPLEAKLWEIAENLHRADLTAMQRNLLVGRWVKLRAQKIKRDQRDIMAHGGPLSRGRPVSSGFSAAGKELGIAPTTAKRAVKIATRLKPAAQKEATKLGLENQSVALEHASRYDKLDQQVTYLRDFKAKQVEQERIALETRHILAGTDAPTDPEDAFRKWFRVLGTELRQQIKRWLREMDPVALADDLDRLATLTADDRKAMH